MRSRVWVSIILLPACSLYWGTHDHDAGVDGRSIDGYIVDGGISVDATTTCTVVTSYDWNDGTVQGWSASTSVSNAGSALVFTNQGNGSLQAFGPETTTALTEMDTISFRVQVDRYSAVTSPSQLVQSFFELNTPFPGDGSLHFNVDVSTLAFGQPHVYTFRVSSGTYMGSLTRTAFLSHAKFASLLFSDQGFTANTSAGTLDDFSIVRCPP